MTSSTKQAFSFLITHKTENEIWIHYGKLYTDKGSYNINILLRNRFSKISNISTIEKSNE